MFDCGLLILIYQTFVLPRLQLIRAPRAAGQATFEIRR
jgi:hypothetical protein